MSRSFARLDVEVSAGPREFCSGATSSRCWCFRTRPRKICCILLTIVSLPSLGVIFWIVAKVVALKQYDLPPYHAHNSQTLSLCQHSHLWHKTLRTYTINRFVPECAQGRQTAALVRAPAPLPSRPISRPHTAPVHGLLLKCEIFRLKRSLAINHHHISDASMQPELAGYRTEGTASSQSSQSRSKHSSSLQA